ncbi:MAG: hypothetical protein H7343_15555 [Undibacterium sp.]|nr:hypothetical protein [Opitutaceae bacterium]
MPGNYTETVPCFARGDPRELDARLAARTASHVFSVTDRGAHPRGTTVVHPTEFFITTARGVKTAPLASLTPEPAAQPEALAQLRAIGERHHRALPDLRHALAQGGPTALAAAFVPLVPDAEGGRALGAFALKLMPHLVPPIEGDAVLWQMLLDEFAELSALMHGKTPGSA